MRPRNVNVFAAQEPRRPHHPLGDGPGGHLKKQFVPGRRQNTGAVAAFVGQSFVGPGYPGGFCFHFFSAAQQSGVFRGFDLLPGFECGHMPGTAHDGYVLEACRCRFADGLSHKSLAQKRFGAFFALQGFAERAHHFGYGLEYVAAGRDLFQHRIPPALTVGVAGQSGEVSQWIGCNGLVFRVGRGFHQNRSIAFRAVEHPLRAGGQVHRFDRNAMLSGVVQRLPFR